MQSPHEKLSRPHLPSFGVMLALATLVALASSACASGPLDGDDDVRTWANNGSAVGVYVHAYEPLAFADGELTFLDPSCPVTSDDGTTVTITGGCFDERGKEWVGSATVVRAVDGGKTVTFDGYGSFDDPAFRETKTGAVVVRQVDSSVHEFDVQLVIEGGVTTTIDYAGRVEGGYEGPTVWSGSGTIERDGLVSPTGLVSVATEEETLDDAACRGQAASGTTTIEADGRTAVITYDGATDCDDDEAARLTLDGEDRGLLTGIVCSVSAPGAPVRAPVLLFLGVGLLVAIRSASRPSGRGGSRRRSRPSRCRRGSHPSR
jgi:hypothetical protein